MHTTSAHPSPTRTAEELRRIESLARMRWTAFILFFFVLQAILWTVAITLTSNDPSHVVLDEYGSGPDAWKERLALERSSARLGWKADIVVLPEADLRGKRIATLALKDENERAIENAQVAIQAFHTGHAAEAQTVSATEVAPGQYQFEIVVRNYGNWRFLGDITSGSRRFVFENQIWIDREAK